MAKKRVYEIAKDVGWANKEMVDWLQENGYEVKSHSSSLEDVEADAVIARILNKSKAAEAPKTGAAAGGVVRRRRKKTSGDTEVVTETRIVPGGLAREEEVLRTTEQAVEEVPPEPVEPEALEAAEAEEAGEGEEGEVAAEAAEAGEAPEAGEEAEGAEGVAAEGAEEGAEPVAAAGEGEGVKKLTEPTATQAVVVRKIDLDPKYKPAPPKGKKLSPVRELQVVSDAMGRGREFVDVTKDKAGKRKTPGGIRRAKQPFSKKELITMARERAYIPIRGRKKRPTKKGKRTEVTVTAEHKRIVRIEETIEVAELAKEMGVALSQVVRKLAFDLDMRVTPATRIDVETAQLVAEAFDYKVEKVGLELDDIVEKMDEEDLDLAPRPPVVTVMGHVDHGKTSLLDYIRNAQVAEGEAGGITQHIGAYSVDTSHGKLTFIDTPGHEAFTAMRARGAEVTDIVILVVAADDSVMPQTVEAINHAKDAGVPIVVAINKCDLPQANPDRVRQALTEYGLIPEEWGGETIIVNVSAKTGDGIEQLLESVALQAELLELGADPKAPAEGVVVEARMVKGRGTIASVLIKNGTLNKGDVIFTGQQYGKVKAMFDDRGNQIKSVGPGQPAEVQGLGGVPNAGSPFHVVKNEKAAKELAEKIAHKARTEELGGPKEKGSLADMLAAMSAEEQKDLKVIIKADVQGSIEAVSNSLTKLSTDKVKVTIIHTGVGAVNESDVMLASAGNAIILGFNVKPDAKARKTAEQEGVDVRFYTVIYNAVDDVRAAMEGLLEPVRKENPIGRAEVRDIFRVSGKGTIAGCAVVDGKLLRSAYIRVLRGDEPVFEGKIDGLKRFKEDVREVPTGMECGVSIANFNDVKAGDVLEVFEVEEIRPSL